ncbi:hypothetical protein [Bacillus benzoevorans]|uniref:Uncharacterized protein n=1 Tax=Bacillus benzoevorans TaxID=1456 RepID=A0A7X0HTB3_9BACI|nr:hypothetical protein [Bacillus benzoevorans]MBB6446445.1 hypothetical protein [Bacillus benzoevorans]
MDAVSYVLSKKYTDEQIAISSGKGDIYGIYWDKGSSPTLTRTGDAIGKIANVGTDGQFVQNDFDKAQIYREIGQVTDDYGNVFTRIPKFYIRKKSGPGFYSKEISKFKYPGFYLPWCFWDFVNSKELEYVDIGSYKASLSGDGKLESKPDKYPLVIKTIVDMRNYARANNVDGRKGYQQLDIHAVDILHALFHIEFATLNSQAVMAGFTSGQYNAAHTATIAESNANRIIVANATADQYKVGQAISLGTSLGGNQIAYGRTITGITVYDTNNKAIAFDGAPVNIAVGNIVYNTGWKNGFSRNIAASSGSIVSNTDGKYPFVYRGIESLYGDVWQFVDGVNVNEFQTWICKNAAQYASNVFTSPYEKLGYINANANGYPTALGFDPNYPFAQFPTAVGGGASTYYSDYYWQATGQRIAHVGGYWSNGATDGVWCWGLHYSSSDASVVIGGRLLKKAS